MTLPKNYRDLEKQEQLKQLDNVVKTTSSLANDLEKVYRTSNFPDDLEDYARMLIHEGRSWATILGYNVRKGLTDSKSWKNTIRCLRYINHMEVLFELVKCRADLDLLT